MKTKLCSKCKKSKHIIKFYKDKRHKDNLFSQCINCVNEYKKKYYKKNQGQLLQIAKKYRDTHKEERKIYCEKNKVKIAKQHKEYNLKYKTRRTKQKSNYVKQRRATDINFKILTNLRTRINRALQRNSKSESTQKLLGCSIVHLKQHLEKQFVKGMTWKNWTINGWHIDHIKSCVNFDLSKPSEQQKCFNYTNLQPLWAKDNLIKGAK